MTPQLLALELRSIHKAFGRTTALAGASLRATPGTLHMLLGENGAGKTTLLNIAAGLQRADAGSVVLAGREVHWRSPSDALTAGIAAVQQHFSLIPSMTVAENVALGGKELIRAFRPARVTREVRQLAGRVGLAVDPEAIVGNLPVAAQQRAEILKALARGPTILILDEPTAVLAPDDARRLYEWLRRYVDSGNTAVVITHHVREAHRYGDAVTVLRSGHTVLERAERATPEADLVAAILGEPSSVPARHTVTAPAVVRSVALRATGITIRDSTGVARLREASLIVQHGEALGVAGVDGSGHRELLRALAGRVAVASGTVDRPAAIAFIPEDRHHDALIPGFTLVENFAIRGLAVRTGTIGWNDEMTRVERCIRDFDVRGATARTRAEALSGGNQQRFVLARELDRAPACIIAENPTRGLDIRASASILKLLRERVSAGAALVMYSTDIDELLQVADRVVVCQGGALRQVVPSIDAIGAAMVGAA